MCALQQRKYCNFYYFIYAALSLIETTEIPKPRAHRKPQITQRAVTATNPVSMKSTSTEKLPSFPTAEDFPDTDISASPGHRTIEVPILSTSVPSYKTTISLSTPDAASLPKIANTSSKRETPTKMSKTEDVSQTHPVSTSLPTVATDIGSMTAPYATSQTSTKSSIHTVQPTELAFPSTVALPVTSLSAEKTSKITNSTLTLHTSNPATSLSAPMMMSSTLTLRSSTPATAISISESTKPTVRFKSTYKPADNVTRSSPMSSSSMPVNFSHLTTRIISHAWKTIEYKPKTTSSYIPRRTAMPSSTASRSSTISRPFSTPFIKRSSPETASKSPSIITGYSSVSHPTDTPTAQQTSGETFGTTTMSSMLPVQASLSTSLTKPVTSTEAKPGASTRISIEESIPQYKKNTTLKITVTTKEPADISSSTSITKPVTSTKAKPDASTRISITESIPQYKENTTLKIIITKEPPASEILTVTSFTQGIQPEVTTVGFSSSTVKSTGISTESQAISSSRPSTEYKPIESTVTTVPGVSTMKKELTPDYGIMNTASHVLPRVTSSLPSSTLSLSTALPRAQSTPVINSGSTLVYKTDTAMPEIMNTTINVLPKVTSTLPLSTLSRSTALPRARSTPAISSGSTLVFKTDTMPSATTSFTSKHTEKVKRLTQIPKLSSTFYRASTFPRTIETSAKPMYTVTGKPGNITNYTESTTERSRIATQSRVNLISPGKDTTIPQSATTHLPDVIDSSSTVVSSHSSSGKPANLPTTKTTTSTSRSSEASKATETEVFDNIKPDISTKYISSVPKLIEPTISTVYSTTTLPIHTVKTVSKEVDVETKVYKPTFQQETSKVSTETTRVMTSPETRATISQSSISNIFPTGPIVKEVPSSATPMTTEVNRTLSISNTGLMMFTPESNVTTSSSTTEKYRAPLNTTSIRSIPVTTTLNSASSSSRYSFVSISTVPNITTDLPEVTSETWPKTNASLSTTTYTVIPTSPAASVKPGITSPTTIMLQPKIIASSISSALDKTDISSTAFQVTNASISVAYPVSSSSSGYKTASSIIPPTVSSSIPEGQIISTLLPAGLTSSPIVTEFTTPVVSTTARTSSASPEESSLKSKPVTASTIPETYAESTVGISEPSVEVTTIIGPESVATVTSTITNVPSIDSTTRVMGIATNIISKAIDIGRPAIPTTSSPIKETTSILPSSVKDSTTEAFTTTSSSLQSTFGISKSIPNIPITFTSIAPAIALSSSFSQLSSTQSITSKARLKITTRPIFTTLSTITSTPEPLSTFTYDDNYYIDDLTPTADIEEDTTEIGMHSSKVLFNL